MSHWVPAYGGGGIYFGAGCDGCTITDSTISGNSAAGADGGGALYIYNSDITATISNSTIVNNTATLGGAFSSVNWAGTLNVLNSTIANNTAMVSGGAFFPNGGILNLDSTVVAGNSAAGDANDFDDTNTIVDAQYSAWSSSYTPNGSSANNINPTYASLGFPADTSAANDYGLAANGAAVGAPLTLAFAPDSPLLNAGENSQFLSYDERGPGFPRSVGATDIGAFEFQVPTLVVNANSAFPNGDPERSEILSIDLHFSSAVAAGDFASIPISLTRTNATATGTVGTVVSNMAVAGTNTGLISLTQIDADTVRLTFSNADKCREHLCWRRIRLTRRRHLAIASWQRARLHDHLHEPGLHECLGPEQPRLQPSPASSATTTAALLAWMPPATLALFRRCLRLPAIPIPH